MKVKLVAAILLLVVGVGLCVYRATRPVEGRPVQCSAEVTSELEQVFQSLLESKSKGGWNGTRPYWVEFPGQRKRHLYQKLVFGGKKVTFAMTDAIEVPSDADAVILHGSLSTGQHVAVHFVKRGSEYKIKSIDKYN